MVHDIQHGSVCVCVCVCVCVALRHFHTLNPMYNLSPTTIIGMIYGVSGH